MPQQQGQSLADQFLGSAPATAQSPEPNTLAPEAAGAPTPAPQPGPATPDDLADQFLGRPKSELANQFLGTAAPTPKPREDLNDPNKDYLMSPEEPWLSRTWAYLNKPLYNFRKNRTFERAGAGNVELGFEKGAEDIVTGLTSPLTLALTLGTFGSGAALDAMGIAAKDIPVAIRGLQALVDTGFTVQQAVGLASQVPGLLDALKFGDTQDAVRLATDAVAGTGFVALGGIGALHRWGEAFDAFPKDRPIDTLQEVRKAQGVRREALTEHSNNLRAMEKDLRTRFGKVLEDSGLRDAPLALGALTHWMETGGDVDRLADLRAALAGTTDPVHLDEVLAEAKKIFEEPEEKPAEETKPEETPAEPVQHIEPHPQESAFTAMLRQGAEQAKARTREQLTEEAVKHFGVTEDLGKVGYVLPDGRGLDFSGSNAARTLSHEAIADVGGLREATLPARAGFMADTGAIRTHFADGQVMVEMNADTTPTDAQLDWIKRALGNEPHSTLAIDLTSAKGAVVGTSEIEDAEPGDLSRALIEARKKLPAAVPKAEEAAVPAAEVVPSPENGQVPAQEQETAKPAPEAENVPEPEQKPPITNAGFMEKYTPKERARLLAEYDLARHLPEPLQAIGNELRGIFDEYGQRAQAQGFLRHLLDNYVTNIWNLKGEDELGFLGKLFGKPAENIPPVSEVRHQINGGAFDTNFPFARKRVFDSAHQAEMLGYKRLINDPITLAMNYMWRFEKTLADRDFLETFLKNGLRMGDGSPVAALEGTGKIVGEESRNPAVLIKPEQMRAINIDPKVLDSLQESGALQKLIDSGRIERVEKQTAKGPAILHRWRVGDYAQIDHPAMRGWQWVQTSPDGSPVLMEGHLRFHPAAADYIRRAIETDRSWLRDTPIGKLALVGSGEAKHLLLSLSPFHVVQEGLRAVMAGVNPFFSDMDAARDLQAHPRLRLMVRNSLDLGKDYNALDRYLVGRNGEYSREGVGGRSRILNMLPGLRDIQNKLQEFLFDRYIPSLKARAAEAYFDRYRATFPELSEDEVAHKAAERTNEMFGGLNYVELGRSAATQDMFRLGALAPDWLESEIRLLGRSLGMKGGREFKISWQDNARIAGGLFLAARVMNLLVSGRLHPEAPFGVVEPGKNGKPDTVISLRTLPTDMLHALSDPAGFIRGRVNPLTIRPTMEFLTGRDQYGRRVKPMEEVGDFVKNIVPIPSQTAVKQLMGQVTDLSNIDQVAKASGFTAYHYRTEAEKVAQEEAADQSTSGPLDPIQQEKRRRDLQLEDWLRQGQVTKQQLYHDLPRREADSIIRYATMSPLQARFYRLPMMAKLNVWAVAQPAERDELHEMLWKARYNWLKAHMHNGRVDDPNNPTWLRLQQLYPDLARVQ